MSVWEAHLIAGHHSNGQDGCLLTTQTRDPTTSECVPPGTPTAETINRRDGSFSTNYIRTGINYSRNWMESDFEATREARVRVEVEHHPRAWIDDEIEDLYGRTRLNGAAAYATRHVRILPPAFRGVREPDVESRRRRNRDRIVDIRSGIMLSIYAAADGDSSCGTIEDRITTTSAFSTKSRACTSARPSIRVGFSRSDAHRPKAADQVSTKRGAVLVQRFEHRVVAA